MWARFCNKFGTPEETPKRIRVQNFSYQPGRRILVSYLVEYHRDDWVVDDQFAVYLRAGKRERIFRYPDDPFLPGLATAASPIEAHSLLAKLLQVSPKKLYVDAVRYRPGTRAVLRHEITWGGPRSPRNTLFARVLPPSKLPRLLSAAALVGASGFTLPRLVATWDEGGVAWMTEVPGKTLRERIRTGNAPEPERVLDALSPLWEAPFDADEGHPLNVAGGFNLTNTLLTNVLAEGGEQHDVLTHLTSTLQPFAEAWQPTARAHNDFHDDQVIVTPDDHLAIIDFEETGPGDPQIDIANILAHLNWMAHFGRNTEAYGAYREQIRTSALGRFGWNPADLNIREGFLVFRLASNPVRQMKSGWRDQVEAGLALASEIVDRSA
ncbi:MAG: phosphotransferase [Chloroflexi bacterium]|nr:phosphotransferase [Chloroflexota bacterium]